MNEKEALRKTLVRGTIAVSLTILIVGVVTGQWMTALLTLVMINGAIFIPMGLTKLLDRK